MMMIDGLSVEAEERSRLQRLPWHEQIDTTAPPPKCRVLRSFMRFILRCWMSSVSSFHLWWASSSSGHLQPPGPSGAPPSPHSLLVTVTPSKLPLQLTIWIGWWHSYNTLLPDVEQSRGHMRYTYIILGHLARRQLRYCEGHVCLKMDLSGLKSEQEP